MRRLAILAIACAAGCTPVATREEPRAEIRVVAVLPFLDQTSGSSFDADEFANILASELVKIGGVRVIRPAQIRSGLEAGESLSSVNDAVRVGRRVRADAVLACAITDYDPYDPPKIGISVQFLRVAAHPLASQDLDRMLQSASWKQGPFPMSPDKAGHVLALFEDVYDAQDGRTRGELIAYARREASGNSAAADERDFLAVQSRYLKFVSSRVVQRAWESHGP